MKIIRKNIGFMLSVVIFLFISCASSKLAPNTSQNLVSNQINEKIVDLGDGWFQVTESIIIANITPEQAGERAILNGCKRVIEYYSGTEINSNSLDIQAGNGNNTSIDNFSSVIEQTSKGIIITKEIMKDEIISKENHLLKVVTMKIKVGSQKGEKDPAFNVTAKLNREYFKVGDELELSVKSSKDCYLTILNICSNDSVYVIFPNEYRNDNFVRAGENYQLPNSSDKNIGLSFPVNLLSKKNKDNEVIKVLATKEKIDFASVYSFSAYGTYKTALYDLQKWLLKIPRNEIEEVNLQYIISK